MVVFYIVNRGRGRFSLIWSNTVFERWLWLKKRKKKIVWKVLALSMINKQILPMFWIITYSEKCWTKGTWDYQRHNSHYPWENILNEWPNGLVQACSRSMVQARIWEELLLLLLLPPSPKPFQGMNSYHINSSTERKRNLFVYCYDVLPQKK